MIKTDNDLRIQRGNGEVETVVTIEMLKKHLRLETSTIGGVQEIILYYGDELITSTTSKETNYDALRNQ